MKHQDSASASVIPHAIDVGQRKRPHISCDRRWTAQAPPPFLSQPLSLQLSITGVPYFLFHPGFEGFELFFLLAVLFADLV